MPIVDAEPGTPVGLRDEYHRASLFTLAGLYNFKLEHSVDLGIDEFPSSGTHTVQLEPDGLGARLLLDPVLRGLDGAQVPTPEGSVLLQ